MTVRKSQNKNQKENKAPKKKNGGLKDNNLKREFVKDEDLEFELPEGGEQEEDEEDDEEYELKDDNKIEEMLEAEMHGEISEEDDEEFIQHVEEFEKGHSKSKIVNIFNRIGKPKFRDFSKLDSASVKEELKRIILLLDKYNIIVHFHNDYPDREKYRFITQEIFKEFAEYDKKHHITFLYEDYHPEMAEDEDDEEF